MRSQISVIVIWNLELGRDGELERMTTEQKETLVKELDFSAEKGKEEMARMREGMAELLDERVGDCVL